MGGNLSRFDIVLDQEEGQNELLPILAGSVFHGKVMIDVRSPFRISNCMQQDQSIVQLKLYGKEKVRMNTRKAKRTKTGNHPAPKIAERQLLNIPLHWASFPVDAALTSSGSSDNNSNSNATALIPIGSYEFPFQIHLPVNLPSSTYYPIHDNRSRSKMRFRIQYKLVASIHISQNRIVMKPKNTVTRYLWVAAASVDDKSTLEPVPCMIEPISFELRNTFFQKGTFLFGACIDNTRLYKQPNEIVSLHVSCRNDSSVIINAVQISILEKVTWGTSAINHIDCNTGICTSSSTLQQTEYIPISVLNDVQLPGLVKEHKGFIKSVVESMFGTTKQNLQRQVYNDLISGENLIPITLPNDISRNVRESYNGQLIQISHMIRILFRTNAFCKTPTLDIPIYLLARPSHAMMSVPDMIKADGRNYTRAGKATYQPSFSSTLSTKIPILSTAKKNGTASSVTTGTSSESSTSHVGSSNNNCHNTDIPMATAVLVHENENDQSSNIIVIGGDAILPIRPRMLNRQNQSSQRLQAIIPSNVSTSISNLVPLAAPCTKSGTISITALLSSMRSSINDYDFIQSKICDPLWIDLFQQMSANEYGSIVAHVHEFDQPRVALLLVPFINRRNGGCTCSYAAAAIQHTQPNHRAVTAQKLIPLCIDIHDHHGLIVNELNGWEQTITEPILSEALS